LSFRLLHVFDMAPDGLIRRENVWLDLASIMQQLGAAPAVAADEQQGVVAWLTTLAAAQACRAPGRGPRAQGADAGP
jgi:hypothetical protein